MKKLTITIVIFFFFTLASLYSQSFNLYSIDTSNFPFMRAMFYARTPMGVDYPNIIPTDFDFFENSKLMNSTLSVDCRKVDFYPQLAVVLVLDVSTSMNADAGNGERRIDWVKQGAFAFLDSIKLDPPSVMAYILFAGDVDKTSPLYDSKQPLYDWLNRNLTIASGSTDFYPPFVRNYPPLGSLPLLETAPKDLRRVVIFLTDGEPERPFLKWKVDTVTAYAKRIKAQVYSIFITSPLNPDIDYICQQTAGKSFSVYTKQELINAFKKIVGDVQSRNVCYLTWIAPFGCDESSRNRSIKAIFKRIPDSVETSYLAPQSSIARLEVSDDVLLFGAPGIGTTKRSLTLTAKNSDFIISDFDFSPNSGKFSIDWKGKPLPFQLLKDESHTIEITYVESPPTASTQVYLSLNASPCSSEPVLLVAPCGGEFTERIDFGNVPIQSSKTYLDSCLFRNTTAIEISGSLSIEGPNKDEFKINSGGGPFKLKPNECLNVVVEFNPKTVGLKTAFLKFNIPDYCGDFQSELIGNGISSSLPIPILSFNVRRILTINDTILIVRNTSPVSVLINSAVVQQPNDSNYKITLPSNFPILLDSGDSLNISVSFIPQEEGLKENAVLFTLEGSIDTVMAKINGIGGLPKIFAPDVDCGKTPVSSPKTADLIISNPSQTMDLFVEEVLMPINQDFRFAMGATTKNFIVPKNNGSVSIPVEFIPTKTGLLSIPVLVVCDAAPGSNPEPPRVNDTIIVSGIGLGLVINPNPYLINNISACAVRELDFTIDNTLFDTENNITDVEIDGIDKNYFQIVDYSPKVLAFSKGFIKVRFNPQVGKNDYRASLVVKSDFGSLTVPIQASVFSENITPEINFSSRSVQVKNIFDLPFTIDIKNNHSVQITNIEFDVKLNRKSLVAKSFTSDLLGWIWQIQDTNDGYIVQGRGTPVNTPLKANFLMNFDTYLSSEYETEISIFPRISEAVECLIPTLSKEKIILTTCFTSGRIIVFGNTPFHLQEVAPNPVVDDFDVNFSLAYESEVQLSIYNIFGELVQTITSGHLSEGNYSFYIPAAQFPKGVYFIKMSTGDFVQIRSFIILK